MTANRLVERMQPQRVVDDLRALAALTSDDGGAQRVAFTPVWDDARNLLRGRVGTLGLEIWEDHAHNLWALRRVDDRPPIAIGSHLDSVPDGGWLDGALGVLAGVEVMRAAADAGLERSLLLVDWADEEGRFGHSLLGSAAASGNVDLDALRATDAASVIDLDALPLARKERPAMAAYLELHIEQGPVLEAAGVPVAAVSGTYGVRREQLVFHGQAAHAGATPLEARRDPVTASARLVLDARALAARHGGLATIGSIAAAPGTPTAIAETATLSVDLRHAELAGLEAMRAAVLAAAQSAADAERCELASRGLWSIDPIAFDAQLVAAAHAAGGAAHPPLVSGPLHDAAEVARMGVPAAMLFVRSQGGISHSPQEDSLEDDLHQGVLALGRTVASLLDG